MDDKCQADTEPVFSYIWPGTSEGCLILDTGSGGKVANFPAGTGHVAKIDDRPGCGSDWIVEPVPSIKYSKFNGKIICGKRGGKPFVSVIRPDPETGSCPENTTPCFQSTNIQNMVCYPPDEHDSCPITEIVFADQ